MDMKATSHSVFVGVMQDQISRNALLSTVAPALAIVSPVSRAKQVCDVHRVNIKKVPPTTFVNISAMREDFCMTF